MFQQIQNVFAPLLADARVFFNWLLFILLIISAIMAGIFAAATTDPEKRKMQLKNLIWIAGVALAVLLTINIIIPSIQSLTM